MKILKRNQLIILVISLMLVTAGYLNFTSTNESLMTSEVIAELGDATLVSSSSVDSEGENKIENNAEVNNTVEKNTIPEENIVSNEVVETSVSETDDTYFITSKLERDSMYSEMLETYQEIYANSSSSAEQKNTAIQEIANINKTKNAIMICENLISAKGFKNVMIFVNDNSISVVIGEEELEAAEIAQIQNIVSRELQVDAGIIHISTK